MDITNGIKVNFIDEDTIIEKNLILQPNVSAEDLQAIEDYVYNEAIRDGAQDLKDYYDPLFEAKSEELDTAISNEVTRAQTAEQANATAISNEITRAQTAEQANATAIANEITRAQTAEQTIDNKIKKLYRHVVEFYITNPSSYDPYPYCHIIAVFYSHKSTPLTDREIGKLLADNGSQPYGTIYYPASGWIRLGNKYYPVVFMYGYDRDNNPLQINYINTTTNNLESYPIHILVSGDNTSDFISEVSTPL